MRLRITWKGGADMGEGVSVFNFCRGRGEVTHLYKICFTSSQGIDREKRERKREIGNIFELGLFSLVGMSQHTIK